MVQEAPLIGWNYSETCWPCRRIAVPTVPYGQLGEGREIGKRAWLYLSCVESDEARSEGHRSSGPDEVAGGDVTGSNVTRRRKPQGQSSTVLSHAGS